MKLESQGPIEPFTIPFWKRKKSCVGQPSLQSPSLQSQYKGEGTLVAMCFIDGNERGAVSNGFQILDTVDRRQRVESSIWTKRHPKTCQDAKQKSFGTIRMIAHILDSDIKIRF